MSPFWNRNEEGFPDQFHEPVSSVHHKNVWIWFTLILFSLLSFDMWIINPSGWLLFGNVVVIVALGWLVLAKMR